MANANRSRGRGKLNDAMRARSRHLRIMAFSSDLQRGFSGFFRAHGFIRRNGMAWMYLLPAALWIVLTIGFIWAMEAAVDQAAAWATANLRLEADAQEHEAMQEAKGWLNSASHWLVRWTVRLGVIYLLFVANKYLVLILLSPLFAYASELAEERLTGRAYPFSWGQLMRDAFRGALIALRNGVLELLVSVVVWVATFFLPIAGPVSFILLFTVSAYFYGFSMFDYVYERRRMRIGERSRAVNAQFGAVIANGACLSLLMKVPLIGLMMAPLMASVGAVISTVERGGSARLPIE